MDKEIKISYLKYENIYLSTKLKNIQWKAFVLGMFVGSSIVTIINYLV